MSDTEQRTRPYEEQFVRDLRRYTTPGRHDNNPNQKQIAHRVGELATEHWTFATLRDNEEIWAYHSEDGIWKPDSIQNLRMLVDQGVGDLFTPSLMRSVENKIKARTLADREDFGVPAGTVPVDNGLLDIESRTLQPLTPEAKATWKLSVTYDSDADCPTFRTFLEETFTESDHPLIQEYIGYSLTSSTEREKALVVFGPTNSGKSVFLDVIEALFGDEQAASVAPQEFTNSRWGKARLEHKQVNVRHDITAEKFDDPGVLKEIISGNRISAERKGQPMFEFRPRTKHFFAGNNAPRHHDEDEAFWNRWLTVRTQPTVPREEQDLNLAQKLTTDTECSGILNWALDGLDRLEEQGHFTNAPAPEENRSLWYSYGSSVEQFIADEPEITKHHDDFEFVDDLYEEYESYAKSQGLDTLTRQTFGRRIRSHHSVEGSKRDRGDGTKARVYTGVVHVG